MKINIKYFILMAILISYQTSYPRNNGLRNCGNSCYFNASLQCLSHLDKFNSQLQDGLYDPKDLIPRFYIGLMDKIKGNGIIECKNPILGKPILGKQTEDNFYTEVGKLFFGQERNQEDSPEFIGKLFKNILEGSSYYREIKGLIKKSIEPIFNKAFDKITPDNKKFNSTAITTDANLAKIYSRFFKNFRKGLDISKKDLLTNILNQCMEFLDKNPDTFKEKLLGNLSIKSETQAQNIVDSYIKTAIKEFQQAYSKYKNIQIDEDILMKNATCENDRTRTFTPKKDGFRQGKQPHAKSFFNIYATFSCPNP